ncbi:MAG: helix-hairpin-helix domain-containing protein [Bacteroidales bacterium]|nr:helix-hairpin-helix domain-containing protein [Bacteroidales bacterium]
MINVLLPFLIKNEPYDFSAFEVEIKAFENRQNQIRDSLAQRFSFDSKIDLTAEEKIHPFYFDPNNLPTKKWQELGLDEWQINVIINYENKGGKFKKKQDLARIYSISEEEFNILEPFIIIQSENEEEYKKEINLNPFTFDPNELSKEKFLEMGLPENVVTAIINYRDKGGKFYDKEDLKRIYTLKDEEYKVLEPFIKINGTAITEDTLYVSKSISLVIELNSADTLDLQQLRGIGPSFAKRIVKYRELLGGYCRTEQLLEVYGMDSLRYAGIKDHLSLNYISILKINLNQATIKEMIKHPYIEFYLAKSIITYREETGGYKNLEELRNAKLIYEELYQKIKPYLTLTDN